MNDKTPDIDRVLEALLSGQLTREQAVASLILLVGDKDEAEFIVAHELGENPGDVIL